MKLFKRISSFFLLLCILLSLAACAGQPSSPTPSTAPTTDPTVSTPKKQTGIVNTDGMTDLQKAVVITAESYFLRGKYAQYDQYSLTAISSGNVGRRQVAMKAPEDYTAQNYGYTDCSGFVYDLYYFALGMSITDGDRNTKGYCTSSMHTILSEQPEKNNFDKLSKEELAAKEKEFLETLQPGDIIVYRYAGNNAGHAMVYVGNGMMIHSSGSTYDYKTGTEKAESAGTYQYTSIQATLLMPGNRRYLFDKHIYIIMRPLNNFKGQIPASTMQRMDLMRGVVAEKLSSHTYGQTAGPGDTVTFTYRIKNNSNVHKDLTITDTLSPYVTYVSGAQNVSGNNLSWNVTVHSGQTLEVSYTVQVNAAAPLGEHIVSNSFISGVPVNNPSIKIAKTLSETQQTAVVAALNELKGGELQGIALINAVYEKVIGKTAFTQQSVDELWADLVTPYENGYVFHKEGALYNMIAPNLYGGRMVAATGSTRQATLERTRLLTAKLLVPGDVVLADNTIYLFTGDSLMKLSASPLPMNNAQLQAMLANKRFVVLRPSMVL